MNRTQSKSVPYIFGLSFVGFLFSGYLTFYKLFFNVCAFNESCTVIWGHPACWYGFALFATLLVFSVLTFRYKLPLRSGLFTLLGVSFVGAVFAGYLTLGELPALLDKGFSAYQFGIPTCMMGFIFFKLIILVSLFGIFFERDKQ